jgi:enoyl-CoA hydratase
MAFQPREATVATNVTYERKEAVAVITLDGPPTNSYDLETLKKLDAAIVDARFDHGHAIGGGLEIALACDLRIARAGKVNVGFPEIGVGVLPGSGGTQRLPRLIGKSKALEMIFEGQVMPIDQAHAAGIVNKVWQTESDAEFKAKALEYVQNLTPPNKAPRAVGAVKRAIQSGLDMSLDEGLSLELEFLGQLFSSEDAKIGLAAFAAKGKPSFTGR